VTKIDLATLRLRPGEVRRQRVDATLDPFVLGGQRYELLPHPAVADLEVSEASGALVFTLSLDATLSGPCMRCLGHAELPLHVSSREFHDPSAARSDELHSDYVVADQLDVSAWARDLVALELPEQIVCREDCAGLCPVCGKDLNVEPHEHTERVADPRWAALEQLREEL
jgi:uncharacterized protein